MNAGCVLPDDADCDVDEGVWRVDFLIGPEIHPLQPGKEQDWKSAIGMQFLILRDLVQVLEFTRELLSQLFGELLNFDLHHRLGVNFFLELEELRFWVSKLGEGLSSSDFEAVEMQGALKRDIDIFALVIEDRA